MEETKQIITLGGEVADVFAPNPDDYETHTLIGDSIRGNVGDVVQVHKNDLAILRANKLIAAEGEAEPVKAETKGKGKGGKATQAKAETPEPEQQPKAEADAPEAAPAADLPAIPSIADMPGV